MTARPTRALTVRQPWADAITHGGKPVENRTWPVPRGLVGVRLLIHAGGGTDPLAQFALPAGTDRSGWPGTRSAVISVLDLSGCHFETEGCCARWGQPQVFHWELTNVVPLDRPVPCAGRLGLWVPPQDVLAAVEAQLAGAAS